jgi:putative transposase
VRRRLLVAHVRASHDVSERRACKALGFARSTVRYVKHRKPDEELLREAIIAKVDEMGAYG